MDWQHVLLIVEGVALGAGLLSAPSVLLERKTRPTSAIVWLLVFVFVPFIGVPLWWTMGRLYMRRRRGRKHRTRAEVVSSLTDVRGTRADTTATGEHPTLESMGAREQARGIIFSDTDRVFASARRNAVRVLVDAAAAYPAMLAAIAAATDHVHFQFYIYEDDATGRRFRDALVERARAGVEVRVLVDGVGGAPVLRRNRAFFRPLLEAGGHVQAFLPLRLGLRRLALNFRNHRKILVIDGRVAFTGGLNIGDEYTGDWHDLALHLEGPVIDQLQEVFAEDWRFAADYNVARPRYFGRFGELGPKPEARPAVPGHPARCRVVASGPDRTESSTFQIYFYGCTTARKRIWIVTPYFIPDQAMLVALSAAARRGVDVRILVPQKSDVPLVQMACRSYYEELLQGQVRIFEYQPAILHAKMLLFDDDWAMVGSANVDIRSFRLNFEASCFMEGPEINAALADLFERDLRQAVEVRLSDVRAQSRWTRIRHAAAHLFSPLL